MTRVKTNLTNLLKKDKKTFFLVLFVMTFILIGGIQSTYACYYKNSDSLPILSALIGDFDSSDSDNGDVNIIIYKETDVNSKDFVKTFAIPTIGYSISNEKPSCKGPSGEIECVKAENETVGATSQETCNYYYKEDTQEIILNSKQKVTCKFNFNKNYKSDVDLYVMMQDANGTHEHGDKKYRIIDNIPAFGFNYSGYSCQNGSTVEIDNSTGNIKVLSNERDVCYAYYDGDLQKSDIIANVYVQKSVGGNYVKVASIPRAQKYKIATDQKNYCHTAAGVETSSVPTYADYTIDIPNTDQKQICEVYLQIDNS